MPKAKALIEYNSSNDYKRFKNAQKEITTSINNAIIKDISKLITEHGEHIKLTC
jgi:plasmid replication initiation protein